MMVFELAKAGFYSGDPKKVRQADLNDVLTAYDFILFERGLEREYQVLNQPKNK
jgi:hypothetical protein